MKTTSTAMFCFVSLCATVMTIGQAHPAVNVGDRSQCCATVDTCRLRAGMGSGSHGGDLEGHLGGVELGGYPVSPYSLLGLRIRRPLPDLPRFANADMQLSVGAGMA
ncbi:hypothetical protein MRX96_057533 [Rhipicephalus microplus]